MCGGERYSGLVSSTKVEPSGVWMFEDECSKAPFPPLVEMKQDVQRRATDLAGRLFQLKLNVIYSIFVKYVPMHILCFKYLCLLIKQLTRLVS